MTIGIDIRDLRFAETGQKTTLEEWCKQFKSPNFSAHTFHFFDTALSAYKGKNKLRLIIGHLQQQIWKQLILPWKAWRKKCDIVFCNDYFVPYFHWGFKTVQVFHDAFFFEYPHHYNRLWLKLFQCTAMPAARRSSFIVIPSHYALTKVQQHTGLPMEKLVTIYQAPKTWAAIPQDTPPSWLPKGPYILHMGVLERRKNLPLLLQAFAQFRKHGNQQYTLVLGGKGNGKIFSDDTLQIMQTIQELNLQEDVILPGYIPEEQLPIVYQHAFMYVFPSLNEGFGIPVLEAFQFQVPVLVANNSCLPEIGGDAVLGFNPLDPADICAKMVSVANDPELRKELVAKGQERLRFFSWEKAAHQLMAVFTKAISQ